MVTVFELSEAEIVIVPDPSSLGVTRRVPGVSLPDCVPVDRLKLTDPDPE